MIYIPEEDAGIGVAILSRGMRTIPRLPIDK